LLKDKKVIYKAIFSVYSWDDYLDYPEEHSFYKEINISEELFKRLVNFMKKTKGDVYLCKGKNYTVVCKIEDNELYQILERYILPSIPVGDNTFEVYLEDIYPVYYHLYEITGLKTPKKVEWVEVDERTFNTFRYLNTVVMAKPLGYFEDQILIKPKEIYTKVLNNPYYSGTITNPDLLPILYIIRYRLPEIILPDPNYPNDYKKGKLLDYYSRKKVLEDYAKKYGLDKQKIEEYKIERRVEKFGRSLGSTYRGGGYGGFGK